MPRPAIIIGLGGMGVMTVRHLKALLLTRSRELALPSEIKLVAIDTVRDEGKFTQQQGKAQIVIPSVELEPGEYFWIGGDLYDLVREIEIGDHPHIKSWFQAREYLMQLPRASFLLTYGSGQLRQFGRLAVFHDLAAPSRSTILSSLRRVLEDILKKKFFDTVLDIFVISSMCGGSGSGMLLDFAHLVRHLAREEFANLSIRLNAFLVLPEAYAAVVGFPRPAMRAIAYACRREIRRFTTDWRYDYAYPMVYHGGESIWNSEISTRLFDAIYNVDGWRKSGSTLLPEGVAAAIADIILAIIDGAGKHNEDVYQLRRRNIIWSPSQVQAPGSGREEVIALDSAIGAYSIVLPVHHIQEWLACRLALETLDVLLMPSQRGEDGYPKIFPPDANQEELGLPGRAAALRFLRASEVQSWRTGERIGSTMFFSKATQIVLAYRDDTSWLMFKNKELISQSHQFWEEYLDLPGTPSEVISIRQRLASESGNALKNEELLIMRKESVQSVRERILQNVESYKNLHLGYEDLHTGQRMAGSYGMVLRELADIQYERYRRLLQVECENILNGGQNPDASPRVWRGGKLGYLADMLIGLEEIWSDFLRSLNEVYSVRSIERQRAVQMVQAARQEFETHQSGLFGSILKLELRRRERYLQAEQDLINLEKTLIAEDVARDLATRLLIHTRQLRKSVESWIIALGKGTESLYARLLRIERQIRDAIQAEQQLSVHEVIWDKEYVEHLYQEYAGERLSGVEILLSRLSWHMGENANFNLLITNKRQILLKPEDVAMSSELFLQLGSDIFGEVWSRETVLRYLMSYRFPDPAELARWLVAHTEVMLRVSSNDEGIRSYILQVIDSVDKAEDSYLTQLQSSIKHLVQDEVYRISSEERFKLRLIAILDQIPEKAIDSYKASAAEYRRFSDIARQHVFPAEVNSAIYEQRLSEELGLPPRELHPNIVCLLEYPERLALFTRAYAYNLIRIDENTLDCYLHLDASVEENELIRLNTSSLKILLSHPRAQEPDLIEALFTFVYRKRDIKNVYIIDYAKIKKACYRAAQLVGNEQDNVALLEAFLRKQLLPLERATSQELQDLGAVMHLIVLDEIGRLTRLGQPGLEFFATLWHDVSASNYIYHVRSFCKLLAQKTKIELIDQKIEKERLYLVFYKIDPIFREFPYIPSKLPVLFLRSNVLLNDDIQSIKQLLDEFIGYSPKIIILIVFSDDNSLLEIRQNIYETLYRKYAYDVIVPSRDELHGVIVANNPRQALQRLILSQVSLVSVSPFITVGATSDTMFFGREKELREIAEHSTERSFALIGGRRIGKTSMIARLHRIRLRERDIRTIYQDCSPISTYESFLATPILDWRTEQASGLPTTFGELFQSPPSDKPLVLLLDEVDKLIPSERSSGWKLFYNLRSLINSHRMQIVLGGERLLREALHDPKTPLFNLAQEMILKPLDYRSAEELITRPMKQLGIEFVDEMAVVNQIWTTTSGHPNIVQRLCSRLIERLDQRRVRYIQLEDVNAVISDPKFQEEDFLATYWDLATPLEKIISLLMALHPKPYRLQAVLGLLNTQGVQPEPKVVKAALDRLVDLRSILKRTQAGYEFAVTAFPQVIANTTTAEDLLIVLKSEFLKNPMELPSET